jgi:hypothetical protein
MRSLRKISTFRPKFRTYKIPAALAVILLAVFTSLSFFYVPGMAHEKIIQGLALAGFQTRYIKEPEESFGELLYKDITFDEYNFSTIKFVRVTYNPLTFLLSGRFSAIDSVGLNLTGDWADESLNSLSFSGWNVPGLSTVPFSWFDHIGFSDARLSLLSQNIGGISVFFDAQGNRKDDAMEFQSSIKSEQKFLSLSGNANGTVKGQGWEAKLSIDEGKFEDPSGAYKATRINGDFKCAWPGQGPLSIQGQALAGGITLYGLPWQNVSSALDFSNGETRFLTKAKSMGVPDIALEINLFKKAGTNTAVGGSVRAQHVSSLFDYFKDREDFAPLLDDLKPYIDMGLLDVDYLLQDEEQNDILRYEIKTRREGPGPMGEIILKKP